MRIKLHKFKEIMSMTMALIGLHVFAGDGSNPTAIIHDTVFTNHDTGPYHPDGAWRYNKIIKALDKESLLHIAPRKATEDEILLCHTKEYFELVKSEVGSGARSLSTGDTRISAESFEVALYAAGAVIEAVDAVFSSRAANAFCPVRPPGHHAESNRGMGFCIFNNIAIGARYAQRKYDIERVMIIDWDVHHGNGTEEIFYSDASVLFLSIHQSPLFPGTGRRNRYGQGEGKGFNINIPVPANTTGQELIDIFRRAAIDSAAEFKPQLVMISAGFDALEGDPIGGLKLSCADFAELTRIAMKIADQYASGRLISVLEGGYHPELLGKAAASHVKALSTYRKNSPLPSDVTEGQVRVR